MKVPSTLRWVTTALGLAVFLGHGAQAQTGSVVVNGVTLHYDVAGTGPPLVMIHGWAVNRHYWDDDVARFSPHHTVIRYDRRGYGRSTGDPDLTADAVDLAGLLDSLGFERAAIMGHSQGTTVALTFALRYPERVDALVLVGPGPVTGFPVAPNPGDGSPIPFLAKIARTHGMDSVRAMMSARVVQRFGDDPSGLGRRALSMVASYRGGDIVDPPEPSNLASPPRAEELPTVQAATLIVTGEQEKPFIQVVARVMAYKIPGATWVVIPGGGHTVNWFQPDLFAGRVLEFLDAATGATSED
jgi:pimeloyl-ACP methyl ester carboxylesterase